jgi:hypothetical protein
MGGQACVFYGAAQFSRNLDLLILSDPGTMAAVAAALQDLQAGRIAVPEFDASHLARGHAVHFRCAREDVSGLRIDLMSVLRGVDDFETVWHRRTVLEVDGETIDVMSIQDLVLAKKTQRDKDWPMIQRLMEQSFFLTSGIADANLAGFWLRELRTPELLIRVASDYPEAARKSSRAAVAAALAGDVRLVSEALDEEQRNERDKDRTYWEPLKRELEQFRRDRRM